MTKIRDALGHRLNNGHPEHEWTRPGSSKGMKKCTFCDTEYGFMLGVELHFTENVKRAIASAEVIQATALDLIAEARDKARRSHTQALSNHWWEQAALRLEEAAKMLRTAAKRLREERDAPPLV